MSSHIDDLIEEAKSGNHVNLYLNYQHLNVLPVSFLHLKKVQRVYLKYNLLTSLPQEISRLSSLKELYLHSNNLTHLPQEIGHIKCLESLNVSHNFLQNLPPTIGQLQHLQYLHIANNQLHSLPREVGHLKQLQVLDIMNNNLHMLPWQLSDCVRLETLLFDGNLVEWLPQQLTDLKGLKELSGSRNRLLSLPQDIDKLVSLESLLLDSNPGLFFLPGNLLRLKHLHTVGLNGCNQRPSYKDGGNPYPSRGIHFVGSEEHCVLPLLELSARVVHTDQTLPAYSLPSSLSDLVEYPTAHCYWCGEALFTGAFLLSANAGSAAAIVRCTDSWEPIRVCSKVSMEFVFLTCSLKCSRTVKQNL